MNRILKAVAGLLAFTAGLLLSVATLGAQAPTDTLRLGLRQAVAVGLRDGEEIRIAASRVAEADAQVREARSGLFPKVDFSLAYTRALRTPFSAIGTDTTSIPPFMPDPTAPLSDRITYLENNVTNAGLAGLSSLFSSFPIGQKNTWIGRFTVDQKLFDGAVFQGVKAAKTFTAIASSQEAESRADIQLQIVAAYLDAQLAEARLAITDSTVAQLDAQLVQIRALLAAGNTSELEVLRVEVERENLGPQRVGAQNQREVALLDLRRLLNIPSGTLLVLTDDLSPLGFQSTPMPVVSELVAGATARRASLEASRLQVELQHQQVSADRATRLPTVAANAVFGKQALPSDFLPGGKDFNDDWSVGFTVKMPIFNGFATGARIAQSEERAHQAELQLVQQREAVLLDVERQRGELARAQVLIGARSRNVERAIRVYGLADLAYRQGVATSLELQDARLSLAQARVDEAQALHDYRLALARLRRAAGATVLPELSAGAGAASF